MNPDLSVAAVPGPNIFTHGIYCSRSPIFGELGHLPSESSSDPNFFYPLSTAIMSNHHQPFEILASSLLVRGFRKHISNLPDAEVIHEVSYLSYFSL